jgi:hypothetical protein
MPKSSESKSSAVFSISKCLSESLYKGLAFLWSCSLVTPSEQCQLSMQRVGHLASVGPKLSVKRS